MRQTKQRRNQHTNICKQRQQQVPHKTGLNCLFHACMGQVRPSESTRSWAALGSFDSTDIPEILECGIPRILPPYTHHLVTFLRESEPNICSTVLCTVLAR